MPAFAGMTNKSKSERIKFFATWESPKRGRVPAESQKFNAEFSIFVL